MGAPGALAAAVTAFRKTDWRAYCAAAGDTDSSLISNVSYDPQKLLQSVAAALRDACQLRRQLGETQNFPAASAATARQEPVSVEEPTEAPMAVLDSKEFKALMESLGCTKLGADSSWCLRWDRSLELLTAGVEYLELLTSKDLKVRRHARSF